MLSSPCRMLGLAVTAGIVAAPWCWPVWAAMGRGHPAPNGQPRSTLDRSFAGHRAWVRVEDLTSSLPGRRRQAASVFERKWRPTARCRDLSGMPRAAVGPRPSGGYWSTTVPADSQTAARQVSAGMVANAPFCGMQEVRAAPPMAEPAGAIIRPDPPVQMTTGSQLRR
jgi:hypothetical protein